MTVLSKDESAANEKPPLKMWIALEIVAFALLAACLSARHLAIWASINKGLGTPSGGLLAAICSGVRCQCTDHRTGLPLMILEAKDFHLDYGHGIEFKNISHLDPR